MPEDADLDEWIAGVSGKRPARSADDDAAALRDALRYRRRTAAELSESEKATLAGLLERADALDATAAAPIATAQPQPVRGARRYGRPWALAASVVGVALVAGLLVESNTKKASTEPEIMLRGVVMHVVVPSPNPRDRANAIEDALMALGLRPHLATRAGAVPILITVSVSAAQLPVFGPWLKTLGEEARAAGDYEIEITAASGAAGP